MSGYSPPAVSCRIPATLEPAAMTVRVVHSANEHEGTPIIPSRPALLEPPGLLHPPALPPLLPPSLPPPAGSPPAPHRPNLFLPFLCLLSLSPPAYR